MVTIKTFIVEASVTLQIIIISESFLRTLKQKSANGTATIKILDTIIKHLLHPITDSQLQCHRN